MTPSEHRYRDLLHDGLARAAARHPDKLALHAGDESLSYGELDARSDRLAAALQARGLERGDRVAIFMDNTLPCAVAIFGVLKAGGVFLVINPQTKHDKLCFIANDCAVRHLVTDIHLANVARAVVGTVPSLTHIVVSGRSDSLDALSGPGVAAEWLDDLLAGPAAEMRAPGTIPADLASLIYTSGSTGTPKGVMHTHQSMLFAARSLIEYLRMDSDEVIIDVLPLAFDYGLYQLLMTVQLGATLVLERSFTYPAEIFNRMQEHGVTAFPGVPTIYAIILATHARSPLKFPAVKRITNTAAALPADYVPRLREVFPGALIYKMYGLTECKRVSYLEPELVEQVPAVGWQGDPRHRGLPAERGGRARRRERARHPARARPARDARLLEPARPLRRDAQAGSVAGTDRAVHRRLVPHGRARSALLRRPQRRHHQDPRREGQPGRDRERALQLARGARRGGDRRARRVLGQAIRAFVVPAGRRRARRAALAPRAGRPAREFHGAARYHPARGAAQEPERQDRPQVAGARGLDLSSRARRKPTP
jgi:acyl-CoA synthetase (AMP-forming)/AMP-acid ligase II